MSILPKILLTSLIMVFLGSGLFGWGLFSEDSHDLMTAGMAFFGFGALLFISWFFAGFLKIFK